jgi:hypothetical protein
MKHTTTLIISMIIFIISLPLSIYIASIGLIGLSFSLFMFSGMFLIITLYYPLIAIIK